MLSDRIRRTFSWPGRKHEEERRKEEPPAQASPIDRQAVGDEKGEGRSG